VPGSVAASVEKPGRYYLWNDFRTVYEGRSYNRSEGIPDGIEIRVHDAEGQSLEFVGDKSISSSSGSSSRNSIGYVQVGSPGQLKIEVSGGNEDRIFSHHQACEIEEKWRTKRSTEWRPSGVGWQSQRSRWASAGGLIVLSRRRSSFHECE
jgi:hypothetical protein